MPKKETRYDESIVIAIESDYKEKLKTLAEQREIGFTQLARRAIKDHLKTEMEELESAQESLL